MAMVRIRGRQRRSEWKIKRDIDGFRFNGINMEAERDPRLKNEGGKLWFNPDGNVTQSLFLESEEKIMYNIDTKEVRIK